MKANQTTRRGPKGPLPPGDDLGAAVNLTADQKRILRAIVEAYGESPHGEFRLPPNSTDGGQLRRGKQVVANRVTASDLYSLEDENLLTRRKETDSKGKETHFCKPTQRGVIAVRDSFPPAAFKGFAGEPPAISESLAKFRRDHPDPSKVGFVMMKFGRTPAHKKITEAIRQTLARFRLEALRADDSGTRYHEDLFYNVMTYMHGCGFGIAVFERLENDDFNPNVSLEVGYMTALRKKVCFLKDRSLRELQADLAGKLYEPFDTQRPKQTIPDVLTAWLEQAGLLD